jgi:hypothetical protein
MYGSERGAGWQQPASTRQTAVYRRIWNSKASEGRVYRWISSKMQAYVVRAFARMREDLAARAAILKRLGRLEGRNGEGRIRF